MAFKSDAHWRWWFANQGAGGDGEFAAGRQAEKEQEVQGMMAQDRSEQRQREKEESFVPATAAERAQMDAREAQDREMWADQGFTPNPLFHK